jgi:hypothetical protein
MTEQNMVVETDWRAGVSGGAGRTPITVRAQAVDYHRNGISGSPFIVVLFRSQEGTREAQEMVGIVFEERGAVAVLDRSLLAEGNVRFGENSFRGDVFEPMLRTVIMRWDAEQNQSAGAALAAEGQEEPK